VVKNKKHSGSTQNELVQCDLEFPELQKQVEILEVSEADQFFNCFDKIQKMT
jgi:hypothetical protein